MMTIPFFYSMLAILNFCFGISLFMLSFFKKRQDLHYLFPVFLLRIIYLIPPAIVIYNFDISWSVWTTGPVRVTIVPLMYLYLQKKFEINKAFKKKDFLHFIPTLLDILLTIPIAFFHSAEVVNQGNFDMKEAMQTVWNGNTYYSILAITGRSIIFLQCVYYFFRLVPLIKHCINYQKSEFSVQNNEFIQWSKILTYAFIVMGVFDGVAIFGAYSFKGFIIAMSVCQILISFYTFIYAILFIDEESLQLPGSTNLRSNIDENSNSESDSNQKEWINVFLKEELFLHVDLSLQKTSDVLKIPKYKLTQLIKEAGYDSFYAFVNYYRIERSKQLLHEKPENYIIESIIEQSGFKSRSTFFRVFKEVTGKTPGVFLAKKDQ